MTLVTRHFTNNSLPVRFGNWRIDGDGFLRVTAHVLKEGVYAYSAEETFGDTTFGDILPGTDPVRQYIPVSEFTGEALASLEGKPVTVPLKEPGEEWHQWRNPENALRDFLTVGTIAGRPAVTDDGCIACDMLIMDPDAIRDIQDKELIEVSAGYHGNFVLEEGNFGGRPYHGTQKDLHFNHVLLLPEGMGRCGYDVRIINSREPNSGKQSEGAGNMPTTLKVTVGNRARSYKFQNEEDAAQAEEMLNEEKSFNAEAVSAAIAAKTDLEAQIAELQKQLTEHDQHLADAKKQIEELLTPAAQEAMAEEFVEQKNAEEAIVEAETDNMDGGDEDAEKQKEEFGNVLKKCDSMAERRRVAVTRVMNTRGMKVNGWNQDAFDGAFEILAANARASIKGKAEPKRVPNGSLDIKDKEAHRRGNAIPRNNFERIQKAIKAKNSLPEDKQQANLITRLLNALEGRK
jgi:hypothetical protein